jgi:hypothetical protein
LFSTLEIMDTPETKEIFQLYRMKAAMPWELEPLVAAIESQRNEWKVIAAEALASFRCTQRPEIYPEGHWSRRAQSLLENAIGEARADNAAPLPPTTL